MPGTLTFSGARYPTTPEAGDVPADLLRFGSDIDQLLVLKATSQANRDTLYANVAAGTLVSCAALGMVWQKTTTPPTAAAWRTIVEQGTAVTTGVLIGRSGFSVASQWAKRVNGIVHFRASLTWSGPTQSGGTGGDLSPDLLVFSLQSAYLPGFVGSWPIVIQCSNTTGVGDINDGGDGYATSLVTGGAITSGDTVTVGGSFPGV